jgi:hypothetical protein
MIKTGESIQNDVQGNVRELIHGRAYGLLAVALEGKCRKQTSTGPRDGAILLLQNTQEIRRVNGFDNTGKY